MATPAHAPRGPAQLVLSASVARRFYVEGRSKAEIAVQLGLSRFKVARLLDDARASGLVRVSIDVPGALDVELSQRLKTALGLRHCVVIDTPECPPPILRERLGAAAADLLTEIVTSADVLGLSWARSVGTTARSLTDLPPVPVVQLTGSLDRPGVRDPTLRPLRNVARTFGGPGYFHHAPLVVPDVLTALAWRRRSDVSRAMARINTVTKAVVGVGGWSSGQSTLCDATHERERRELSALGVCGDVSGILVTHDGTPFTTSMTGRTIGITAGELAAIPDVVAVVWGIGKAEALVATVRAGLVTSVVTHSALAAGVLALPRA